MSGPCNRVGLAVVAALLAGCGAPKPEAGIREVTIVGTASLADGAAQQGTLHVQAYYAWAGEGQLRHPLHEMGEFKAQAGEFTGTVTYSPDAGEGLVVYAWLDADGDGVHCTPSNRSEPAGLVVVNGFPADAVRVNLLLAGNCKSANVFFPPKLG
jgi:hypothetical protein